MSEADDRERLRYLQLKAKAAQASAEAAPIAIAEAPPAASGPSGAESFFRGSGQGFLFGQGDKVNGLFQALGEKYLPEANPKILGLEIPVGGGGGPQAQRKTLADLFLTNQAGFKRENDAAYKAHPWLYGGGAVAATLPTLAFGAGARVAGPAVRAASALGKVGPVADALAAMRTGAEVAPSLGQLVRGGLTSGFKVGGLMGIGSGLPAFARGDYGQFAGDVGANAVLGMLGGGVLAPVPRLIAGLAPGLQKLAYRGAVKAAGANKTDVLALLKSGRFESVGKKLIEMGAVRPGANVEEIAAAVENLAQQHGSDVHSILGELDRLTPPAQPSPSGLARTLTPAELSTPTGLTRLPPALEARTPGDFPGSIDLIPPAGTVNQRVPGLEAAQQAAEAAPELPGFNAAQVAERARREILGPMMDQPAMQKFVPGLQEEIGNLAALGDRRLAFTRANDIKRAYDYRLDHTKEMGPAEEKLKELRALINNEIETNADAAASLVGDTTLLGRFRAAKQNYGDLRQVGDFARKAAAGEASRGHFSLSDYIAGIAPALGALVTGHPLVALGGLAGAYGNKLARERGGSFAANAALGFGNRLGAPGNLPLTLGQFLTASPARAQGLHGLQSLSDLLIGTRGQSPGLMWGATP